MYTDSLLSEDLIEVDVEQEQCPECGHIWINDEQHHYHDCRYFLLGEEDRENDFFEYFEESNTTMKSWQYRPAA